MARTNAGDLVPARKACCIGHPRVEAAAAAATCAAIASVRRRRAGTASFGGDLSGASREDDECEHEVTHAVVGCNAQAAARRQQLAVASTRPRGTECSQRTAVPAADRPCGRSPGVMGSASSGAVPPGAPPPRARSRAARARSRRITGDAGAAITTERPVERTERCPSSPTSTAAYTRRYTVRVYLYTTQHINQYSREEYYPFPIVDIFK